jgi:hypothetical protein
MKTIKSNFPIKSIIFWSILLLAIIVFGNRDSLGTYFFAFIPVYFGFLLIRYFTSKIIISDNILSTSISFDKYEIDLDKVKSFEVKKNSLILQILFGLPSAVTQVEYNKYDMLQLNSADPVLLEALSKNDKI